MIRPHPTPKTSVNPATSAEAIGSKPLPYVDHLVIGQNAEAKFPLDAKFRDEVQAVNLGHAAGHAHYSDKVKEDVRDAQAEHEGLQAHLEGIEPIRRQLEGNLATEGTTLRALAVVPLKGVSPTHKRLAGVAKVFLITGDTSILADQAFRASTPLVLSILLGLSLATSVVAIGAKCGYELAATEQRKARGRVTGDVHLTTRPFYDRDTTEDLPRFWIALSAIAALTMLFAVFLLGHGSGDPAELALGYGFLGALTVAGSAAAEAYAANPAADELAASHAEFDGHAAPLTAHADLEKNSATKRSFAETSEHVARHGSIAVDATVTAEAGRLVDTPEVGGYVDGGHIPITTTPPEPMDLPSLHTPPTRSRTRPHYDLVTGLASSDALETPPDPSSDGASANTHPSGRVSPSAISNGATPSMNGAGAGTKGES